MTCFREILGQSWTLKFHKVKLLKFKTFKFNLKFLWNRSFFHYEKIMRFKKTLQQPGARRTGARHHQGSDTPTSARAVLLHTDQKVPNIMHLSVPRQVSTWFKMFYREWLRASWLFYPRISREIICATIFGNFIKKMH